MATALDLIKTAAKNLGAIAAGEELSAADANDSLAKLNSMLDSFALDRLLVFHITQSSYSWASGNASRTIGSGGNFNTTRPTKIDPSTYFQDSNGEGFGVTVVENRKIYDAIVDKTVQSTRPELLFYDAAYPLGTLYAYPVPSATVTLYLSSWQTLQSFAALTTDLALPPGYQHMIENNLTIELESIFNLPTPDKIVKLAADSKKRLKRINAPSVVASLEPGAVMQGQRFDIRTD